MRNVYLLTTNQTPCEKVIDIQSINVSTTYVHLEFGAAPKWFSHHTNSTPDHGLFVSGIGIWDH